MAAERGDYNLTPDGELTQSPGRWLADPETLARLGIDPNGPVVGGDFVSLMEGRNPGTGRFLRPEGAGGGRGGGIDVTFNAPKSVSTVWALAEPWQRQEIEAAHASAVEQSVAYMREQVPVVRRRFSGQVVEEPAKDLIAAEYQHTTARGVAGGRAPDPQLHSHVVITGAVREDDRLMAVSSRPIFRSARELGAHYRAALAHELAERGYEIEQATGRDGKYFELAGVPEELREAFSGRSREVARAAERFRARTGREPKRGELRDLALENRRAKTLTTRSDLERVWRQTGSEHGFGSGEALQLLAGPERPRPDRAIEDRVEARLVEHHAVFEAKDLRTVVFEQAAGEMSPERALQVAKGMDRDRRVLTLEGGRMTTLAVRAQEQAIERTSDPGERQAWAALRRGEPEKAMSHYQAEGQLFFMDDRQLAGEAAVERWAELTKIRDIRSVALIADSSNVEIDRLNARAQHLRAERGELGHQEIPLPHQHYGLREGDLITFTAQHRSPGHPRVENGTRGQVTHVGEHDSLTLILDGSGLELRLAGKDLENLRLAYAQHVYRQQGATVDRSVVLTGGWQTSKESAYVQATRARQATEWFLARDELGIDGQDDRRVMRLAQQLRISRRQTPSLTHKELPHPDWGPGFDLSHGLIPSPLRGIGRAARHLNREPAHDPPGIQR